MEARGEAGDAEAGARAAGEGRGAVAGRRAAGGPAERGGDAGTDEGALRAAALALALVALSSLALLRTVARLRREAA